MIVTKDITDMTWVEIHELDKKKTVLFQTIAPVEEHSHHLPLGTDVFEGEHWRKNAIALLSERLPDFTFLSMPPLPVACAGATGFYGNIYYKPQTVKLIVKELLENVVSWGIKHIILIASHADPIHLIAVERACNEINTVHGVCAISPMGAIFSADELGINSEVPQSVLEMEQRYPNDFHAGWIETSNMLDIAPELVKNCYHSLPDTEISEHEMMSAACVISKMSQYGHLGFPRLANRSLGNKLNQSAAVNLARATLAFVERENYQQYCHHFLYNRIKI